MKYGSRKRVTIEDLNAYATAYGSPIGRKEIIANVIFPGIVLAFLGLLTMKWYICLILFFVGVIYGRTNLLPKSIKRSYFLASMNERGRYMSVTSQIASNDEKSMLMVLRESAIRLNPDGELYTELTRLNSRISMSDVNPVSVHPLFQKLINKYKDDINFSLFLEQLETGLINGNNQLSTLIDIERFHSEVRTQTENFLKMKAQRLNDLKMSVAASWLIVGIFVMTIGIDEYMRLMDTYFVGQLCNGIFILANLFMFNRFNRFYWDDDITSLGDPNQKAKKKKDKEIKQAEKTEQKQLAKKSTKALKKQKNQVSANTRSVAKNLHSSAEKPKQQSSGLKKKSKIEYEQKQQKNTSSVVTKSVTNSLVQPVAKGAKK